MESLTQRNLSYYTKRHHKLNFIGVHKILTSLNYPTAPIKITTDYLKKTILQSLRIELSPTTINHYIRTIQQFFAFLLEEGYLLEDPAKPLKKVKAPKVIIEAFTAEQAKEPLAMPNKKTFVGFRDYCIMLVLLDTGLRLSELLNIHLDDIDLHQRKIKVMGKGAKERYVFFNTTTRDALKKYKNVRGRSL
ncbi:tyrosine-type recombinase/integrase, partial [Pelotomaculum sp. PtaB.Bin117]|uniref:tyrosine-type recombinase/integrase n=1 Tax=Pelotomaculum sp. PtaB.Bin117 TaxID=1811694 RepID=UPI0025809023